MFASPLLPIPTHPCCSPCQPTPCQPAYQGTELTIRGLPTGPDWDWRGLKRWLQSRGLGQRAIKYSDKDPESSVAVVRFNTESECKWVRGKGMRGCGEGWGVGASPKETKPSQAWG